MDFQKIPLDLVKPSPMNPRKTFDENAVNELAANIEKQGLIQPITVRPCEYDDQIDKSGEIVSVPISYEIVCGERRYRAFCQLKAKEDELNQERVAAHRKKSDRFQSIPAIIREMDDDEAFENMIAENLQRQDVDPMEEAFAFGHLIEKGKTPEEIALKFGKSIRFVQDRVKLNSLIPELMLAVKEDKMSISAAMIICKLDEEQQRDFYKKNKDQLNKWQAERYVNNLFMYISQALWSKDEPDFAGTTCGTSCRECQYNTCNHGCLFYEMKAEEKDGKCTNRERFYAKAEEYAFQIIEQNAERLVKVGEPLVKGKMVVGISIPSYYEDRSKRDMQKVEEKVRAKGYEVVNCDSYFNRVVFYDIDDERTQAFLEDGSAYLVLDLYRYTALYPSIRAYYVKRDDENTNCNEVGIPSKVQGLMNDYKRESDKKGYTVTLSDAIGDNAEATINTLNDTEKIAISAALLSSDDIQMLKRGFNTTNNEDVLAYIKENIDFSFNSILRGYIISRLSMNNHQTMNILSSLLPELGRMWCEEACENAIKKEDAKRKKKIDKITKQLSDLGYTPGGKKIVKESQPDKPAKGDGKLRKKYAELKEQHPDSIILFKIVRDYVAIGDDVKVVHETLGIAKGKQYINGNDELFCGFAHSYIDDYLPKLIRAGKRVCICDNYRE